MKDVQSWGNYPKARHRFFYPVSPATPDFSAETGTSLLPFGRGRSYGDVCLNDSGGLLLSTHLNHFLEFDESSGVLRCEAGVTFAEIEDIFVPRGWFLPVVPGTREVTVGGAIANDIHGKNHHRGGTFGCHVRRFLLVRSNGEKMECSPEQNTEWFRATIGGLGLTGFILWAEFALKKIASPLMEVETVPFQSLEEVLGQFAASDRVYEYTVAWLDGTRLKRGEVRGLFSRAGHAPLGSTGRPAVRIPLSVPFQMPGFLLNAATLRLLNELYFSQGLKRKTPEVIPYEKFFYPLDGVSSWNRVYGIRGFLQYQCVVPLEESVLAEILDTVQRSKNVPSLIVLKTFGLRRSPGLLSFPRQGMTLAIDFANTGERLYRLLDQLDRQVAHADGAVNPSKDARMSAESFQTFFPQWKAFSEFMDPKFSSGFWRRVTADTGTDA